MDYARADHRSGTDMFRQERQPTMTANEENPATRLRARTAHAPDHRRLEYRLNGGQVVHVEEARIAPSTLGYLAGTRDHIRADLIRQLKERVRGQFPGGGILVKPMPEGNLPAYTFMVSLRSDEPISSPTADFSRLILCWLSDDIETPLRELIEREICSVEWGRYATDGTF